MSAHEQQELIGRAEMAETRAEPDLNGAIEWTGLPAFHPAPKREDRLVLSFETAAARDELVEQLGLVIAKKTGKTWSAWWPPREREDLAALRFDFDAPADEQGAEEDAEEDDVPGAWRDHEGHEVAVETGVEDGTVVGARCVTCDVDLPLPDDPGGIAGGVLDGSYDNGMGA